MENIANRESMTIEFKSDKDCLPEADIVEAVVAFANSDGGDLYLGVEDDGSITGLHKSHQNIVGLAAMIANKTVPSVSARCVTISDYNIPIIKISVPRCVGITATSSGKILRRRLKADGAPENVPMYPFEITNRLSSLGRLDFSAQPLPDASCSDLDPVERERLRNIIDSYYGEKNLLELSDEELDKALQLITTIDGNLVPTYTGMLLIGRKDRLKLLMPTAETTMQVMQGTTIKVNDSFKLPLLAAFEKINDLIEAWNHEEEFDLNMFRISIPDIDKRAFREALVNAFCHRDYSLLGRVRIKLDDEGLLISNPGGFMEGINIKNLLDAEPHGRNPVLADALKRIGLAERTGRGIDRIFEGSLLYGRMLPDYSASTERNVSLFIPKGIPDKSFIRMISERQKKLGHPIPIYSLLILNILKNQHRSTLREIAQEININETRAKVALETMLEEGLVEAAGNGRSRRYILSSRVYQITGDVAAYVRQSGIDEMRHKELILKLAHKQGYVTRGNVADLLRLSPPQAYRTLQKLVKAGNLVLEDKGRYARYLLP